MSTCLWRLKLEWSGRGTATHAAGGILFLSKFILFQSFSFFFFFLDTSCQRNGRKCHPPFAAVILHSRLLSRPACCFWPASVCLRRCYDKEHFGSSDFLPHAHSFAAGGGELYPAVQRRHAGVKTSQAFLCVNGKPASAAPALRSVTLSKHFVVTETEMYCLKAACARPNVWKIHQRMFWVFVCF